MQTPNPLPEPGWWLVINGDELYEVGHCKGTDNHGARVWCSTLPDDAGVYYWSVNEGEAIWTPWDDPSVTSVHPTLAEAEAAIDATRTVTVLRVTIRHRIPAPFPTPETLRDIERWMSGDLGYVEVRAEVIPEPDPAAWHCAAEEAEHWPETPTDVPIGTVVPCGFCGYSMVRTADGWDDAP